MKYIYRIVSIALIISLIICPFSFATNGSLYEYLSMEKEDTREQDIQELYKEREDIILKLYYSTDEAENILLKEMLDDVNERLCDLGVVFLSLEQVKTHFPKAFEQTLSVDALESIPEDEDLITAIPPYSTNNQWSTYNSEYTINGVTYVLQRLVATSLNPNSKLWDTAIRVVNKNSTWIAAIQNVIVTAAEYTLGFFIPQTVLPITLYEAIQGFASGISPTSEVTANYIQYTYNNRTTAIFIYVKLKNQTDDYQVLSLISTMTQTSVNYSMPGTAYLDGNGQWQPVNTVSGSRTIINIPDEYNSSTVAINTYNSYTGGAVHRAVWRIQISGPESNSTQYIYPCYPSFPAHCE